MHRTTRHLLTVLGAFLLAAAPMGGCGGSGAPDVDLAEVIVVDSADSFTVALVGLGYTGTVDRTWPCSGTQAVVTLGTSLLGGSVRIRVHDDAGTTVYDNVHGVTMGGMTVQTRPGGVAGTWRVILDFTDASWTGAITLDADNPQTNDSISIGTGIGGSGSFVFHADWDASSGTPVHVSVVSGLSSGSIQIRLWDPAAPPATPTRTYSIPFGTGAISDDITTGTSRGTWTIQIDFSGCTLGGAIDVTNGP
jgi:hypothetical protein